MKHLNVRLFVLVDHVQPDSLLTNESGHYSVKQPILQTVS